MHSSSLTFRDLPSLAKRVLVRVRIICKTVNESPSQSLQDLLLLSYLSDRKTYMTRQLETTQAIESCKVYTQMNVPAGCMIHWYAANHVVSENELTWEAMGVEAVTPLSEIWTEYTLGRAFTSPDGMNIRFKAVMVGSHEVYPRIATLGATLT